MTRRERLEATLQGKPVDRPAVSFYEIGGWKMEADGDEFTVWNDPSWRPLVAMAHAETDLVRMVGADWTGIDDGGLGELTVRETWREGDTRYTRTIIRAPGRELRTLERRDAGTQTTWVIEHPLKCAEDVEAYLRLPEPSTGTPDVSRILAEEAELGETGIVSVEFGDPIGHAASLFPFEVYTVLAMTEKRLFHRLLERFDRILVPRCERLASALPGRLWRTCGSEYASEPYLPPRLYDEYCARYTGRIVAAIQWHGGYSRIHSHGRLRGIIDIIAKMGPAGLDPLEPPPQGDMRLSEIRSAIGRDTVLMGNIEAADIENLAPPEFEKKVVTALREGAGGTGRGFVLQPSACPYGRTITPRTMENYRTMIRVTKGWGG